MIRMVTGGLLGGLVLFVIGGLFWGSPLTALAFSRGDEARMAELQSLMAATLGPGGTGTYLVPDPATPQGTSLYGQGPVATVIFNSGGFPVMDSASLVAGLVLALGTGLMVAVALAALPVRGFAALWRTGLVVTAAVCAWIHLGLPVFMHGAWGYAIYALVADLAGFAAATAVIAWMLSRSGASSAQ
ncbi:hypothetical protein GVO57_03685 [Sphingomonas changnyeongensis]|uniref:Uncharacterized protein n=1 Tax=Sphingomonas changnyeongensis TaxID=2698679 RepID=A0A7Z2NUL4_9SPHN|nr:hypothetical protein [Sphingomonas changnyeongensis]QHL90095.1 hypothetical protein GVO57_03685 [Sphingomonas changnyeongensis]